MTAMPTELAAPRRSTAGRVLDLLCAFGARQTLMNLTQLSQAAGLPIATTYRLAKELTASGLLERNADGTYQIGARVWELGALAPRPHGLASAARAALQRLHQSTGEAVHLAALRGATLLVVDRVIGRHSVVDIGAGVRSLPVHATAVGKVHLAFGPAEFAVGVMRERPARYTERTIIDGERMTQECERVRGEGVAFDHEEFIEGVGSVAAPVFDLDGALVAAVGVHTRNQGSLAHLSAATTQTAKGISLALRRGPSPHDRQVPAVMFPSGENDAARAAGRPRYS